MNILGKWLLALTSRTPEYKSAKAELEKVRALPFEEVKQRALALISDTARFRTTTGPLSANPLIESLGPILRDFFEHFESVEEVGGEFSVARRSVSPSSLRRDFLKIGSDFEHSDLIARPGDDRVFIATDTHHPLDDGLPTIYHSIYLLE